MSLELTAPTSARLDLSVELRLSTLELSCTICTTLQFQCRLHESIDDTNFRSSL